MSLHSKFEEIYDREPLMVRAPGRVNLIGEHTDYNEGFVMPASIDKEIRLGIARNDLHAIRLYSLDYEDKLMVPIQGFQPESQKTWANFILGVVQELQQEGQAVSGFDCAFEGDIPLGAGLSSSAALECATVFALNELFQLKLDRFTMVKVAQKAENNFVGVKCGIMDQFASIFGKTNHVIRLDCRSLAYQYTPLHLEGYRIILLDTQVKHSLADSAYNTRRQECESGVNFLQRFESNIRSLRDVDEATLKKYQAQMEPTIYRRCHYVISENQRVNLTAEALKKGDLPAIGAYIYASHWGLSEKYEVSCPELDFLVRQSRDCDYVLGARMMGGGFGGCTLNLVEEQQVEKYIEQQQKKYREQFGVDLKAHTCSLSDGTGLIP